ncbi:MAG: 3-phosphoshikimate 1-carboxyvinyltransferase [Clostridia bacterium]|nr:3-phosphoshikimate 1-carboxyvinyltransferase [Clostridia bacterium]
MKGRVAAAPSKSYAHRLLIAAALSGGSLSFGDSDDAYRTAKGLEALGFEAAFEGDRVRYGAFHPSAEEKIVRVGESGSTLRFLLPLAAALGVSATFLREGRLAERPMGALTETLLAHGAASDGGKTRGALTAGRYEIDATVSSQYVTGLLMALPLLEGDSEIVLKGRMVSAPYVEITLDVLGKAGIEIHRTAEGFFVAGGQKYHLTESRVPGDFSGAAFYLVAGALGEGVEVTGLDLTSAQGDKAVLDALRAAGAEVSSQGEAVKVKGGALRAFRLNLENIPDLAPILSVLAAFAKGESVFEKVGRLRDKESDRLFAIRDMLGRAGIETKEEGDALFIRGGKPRGGVFESFSDHRMCMSAAVLASFAEGESRVKEVECVRKSYPSFWEDLKKVGGRYEMERR